MPFEIHYAPTNDPSSWKTLGQIRKELPSGKWKNSRLFEDVSVALDSGLGAPSNLWNLEAQDQAFVIAYYRVKGTIQAYEDHLHAKELERSSKASKAGKRG